MLTDEQKIYRHQYGACRRTNNPKSQDYYNYGGRGIKICKEWTLMPNPQRDMGIMATNIMIAATFYLWAINNGWKRGLSLDRINNDGDYTPENCRWATKRQQNLNQRKKKQASSRFRGVCLDRDGKHWRITVATENGIVYLGMRTDELSAAKIYNQYIIDNHLENILNEFTAEELAKPLESPRQKSSIFTGVSWDKQSKKWESHITVNYKKIHIGYYTIENEAAKSYNDYVLERQLQRKLNNVYGE